MGRRLGISIVFLLIIRVFAYSSDTSNSINKQHSFNYITIEEGLSFNLVTTIRKDAKEYMWFGTSNGLNKYDGSTVTTYSNIEGDSTSLPKNGIFSLFLDSRNTFWIGTNGGLCYYNSKNDNFVPVPFTFENQIVNPFIGSMCEDNNGILWLGTSIGLISINLANRETKHYPIFDFEKQGNLLIMSLLIESDSILGIGTYANGFIRYNITKNEYKHYVNIPGDETSISENSIATIYKDTDNTIWIGTNNSGINIFNPESNSFKRLLIDETNERSKRVRSIVQDKDGRFWFGTRNGLYTKDNTDNKKIVRYAHTAHLVSTLNNNSIYDIYIDISGMMWLGTYAGGVNYTNLNSKNFYHFVHIPDNTLFLNNPIVQCFAEDNIGNLWIGTENGGLNVLNKKTGEYSYYTIYDRKNKLSSNNIKCMTFEDDDRLWIGTYNGGVNFLDIGKNKMHYFTYQENNKNSLPDNRIYSLLYDSDKNLWVGTGNGLCILNSNKKITRLDVVRDYRNKTRFNSFKNYTVESIFEDNNSNIFVAVLSFGIFQFQKADSSFKRMDIYEYFNPTVIFQDSENNMWMGTNTGLFMIKDFVNSVYIKYNVENGLPSNNICGILEDEKKNLWISTSSGLVKYKNAVNNPLSTEFIIYDQSDGLQSIQFSKGAALKSKNKHLFFGGINGFNAFHPDSINENKFIPPVYLNEFLIFNKPVQAGLPESPLNNVIEQTREIKLSWKESIFSFGFIAINYTNPQKNRYAYKMEGFDQEWNYTDASRRLATYTNLEPGAYTFHVKASNNDGIWNEEGVSIKITITPPLWKTWWFRSLTLIVLLGIIVATFRRRMSAVKKRSREFEKIVIERTRQLQDTNKELETFAYSVSHDLRAPLRSIDGFSQILLEEYPNKLLDKLGQDYLQRVRKGAQRMSQLIDNMLNLSKVSRSEFNVKQINLSNIALEVINELRESNPKRNVKFIIQEEIIANVDGHLLKIVLENLIGNAWKFTSIHPTACIEFGMFPQEKKLVYFVRDDGAGFDMKYADKLFGTFQRLHDTKEFQGTGIGLATVKRIIHRHGGSVWAEGEEEKGATFYFTLPDLD